MHSMKRRRTDWVLVLVGAMIGIAAGLFAALAIALSGPEAQINPVQYSLIYNTPHQPGDQAVLQVEIFGVWKYTKTASDPQTFEAEISVWNNLPSIVIIGLGVIGGLLGGWGSGRIRWQRKAIHAQSNAATESGDSSAVGFQARHE